MEINIAKKYFYTWKEDNQHKNVLIVLVIIKRNF